MSIKRYKPAQIGALLGKIEVEIANGKTSWRAPKARTPKDSRLGWVLNAPFLLIRRTKSGFYAESGPRDSCFCRKVSVFLGPSSFRAKTTVSVVGNLSPFHLDGTYPMVFRS
jgi:hypothetical protein